MGSEWMEVKLSDLGEVSRGRSRHRPRYAEHLYGGSYPFIQTGDIKASEGRINSHEQTYSEAGLAQSRLWPTNTMCITIAANIAETGILQYPACFPDSVIGFIADEGKCDVYFIEYLFRNLRRDLQRQATGSVQDNINLQTLERLKFKVPLLNEQKRISSFLNNFENKIILNQKINQTLEQMAQALFKSWFVDFDPVIDNALDAGNTIPEPLQTRAELRQAVRKKDDFKPLPQAIRELFPNEFEESELGWIPKGWLNIRLKELADKISKGTTPKNQCIDNLSDKDITPLLKVRDINDDGKIMIDSLNFIPVTVSEGELKRSILQTGDILLSIAGTIGRVAVLTKELNRSNCNQAVAFIRLKDVDKYQEFVRLKLRDHETQKNIFSQVVQGVQANFSLENLGNIQFILPNDIAINVFSKITEQWHFKKLISCKEEQQVTKLRDTLLPKLISGELSLADIELD